MELHDWSLNLGVRGWWRWVMSFSNVGHRRTVAALVRNVGNDLEQKEKIEPTVIKLKPLIKITFMKDEERESVLQTM